MTKKKQPKRVALTAGVALAMMVASPTRGTWTPQEEPFQRFRQRSGINYRK